MQASPHPSSRRPGGLGGRGRLGGALPGAGVLTAVLLALLTLHPVAVGGRATAVAGTTDADTTSTGEAAHPDSVGWAAVGGGRETGSTDPVVAARALLADRARAVRERDPQAWRATLADPLAAAGRALAAEFDVLAAIPWEGFGYTAVEPDHSGPAGTVVVRATASARIRGERAATDTTETFVLAATPAGWRLTGHEAAPSLATPWWLPGASAARGEHSVVIGSLDAATLRRYAAWADRAVTLAASAWPEAPVPTPMVVVAPASRAEFATLSGRRDGPEVDQVAGLTDGPLDSTGRATGDRLLLNPAAFAQLSDDGRAFVIAHEAVHVVLRSGLPGAAPPWLTEGFADHVAYAPTGLTPAVVAAAALEEVRRDGPPRAWPTAGDFDASRATIGPAYQRSWVLVELIATEHGPAALRSLVTACTAPGPVESVEARCDRAVPEVLDTSVPALTLRWQQRLLDLASTS